jgi:hypothetical protein
MRRIIPFLFLFAGTLIIFGLMSGRSIPSAQAQCGTTSTCKTCHETLAQKPVNQSGAWHIDHASYDLCVGCHAGSGTEQDETAAHAGITMNLADMAASCYNCHPDEYTAYYQGYADQLGLQAAPSISTSSYLQNLGNALCVTPVSVVPAIPPATTSNTGNFILIGVVALGVVTGGLLIFLNERRLKKDRKGGKRP